MDFVYANSWGTNWSDSCIILKMKHFRYLGGRMDLKTIVALVMQILPIILNKKANSTLGGDDAIKSALMRRHVRYTRMAETCGDTDPLGQLVWEELADVCLCAAAAPNAEARAELAGQMQTFAASFK